MKKSLVALATLTLIGSAFADVDVSGGVKLYGVIDMGVQSQSLASPSTNITSDYQGLFASAATSRLGVKASRDLGDGLKGIAQAEIQLAPDQATLLPSKNRQAFVGLSSETAGTIILGTTETFAYEVFAFDVNGRVEYKPQVWRTTTSVDSQDRANNSIKYNSPSIGGFTGHAMMNFHEQSSIATCTITCATITSYAVKYSSDKLTAAYVHDSITNTVLSGKFGGIAGDGVSGAGTGLIYGANTTWASGMDPVQRDILAFSYDFGPALVSFISAKAFQGDSASNSTNTFGVRVPFEKVTLALSYGTGAVNSAQASTSTTTTLSGDGNLTDTTFGAYYNFDKSTQAYILASRSTSTVGKYEGTGTVTAIGARYNF